MDHTPVHFERYIKLVSKDKLDKPVSRDWLTCVRQNAPSGATAMIQLIDDTGKPQTVAMVMRQSKKSFHYMIPLVRDLSNGEVEKIVSAFAADHEDLDFDIETSETALKPTDRQGLTLDQGSHLALCTALAKRKHEDWVRERANAGWRYGTKFSTSQKTHPLIRPWDQLPDRYRVPDLEWPQKLVAMLGDQGYSVVRKDELSTMLTTLRSAV